MSAAGLTADAIIAALELEPHPEGGWFRETWRAETPGQGAAEAPGARAGHASDVRATAGSDVRPVGTAIYFLLKAGERSHWHRVDATEIWHFHAGAPLELRTAPDAAGPATARTLGADLRAGDHPQLIVPAHHWQAARSLGAFTLVSCTVSPGFLFDGFELAAPGFDIPR